MHLSRRDRVLIETAKTVTQPSLMHPVMIDDGVGGLRRALRRDAVRVKFPPALRGPKRSSAVFAAPPAPAVFDDACGVAGTQEPLRKQVRFKEPSGPVTACLVPARRLALKDGAARLEAEQQRGLQHLLDSRALTAAVRAPECSAAERLAAVRERVLARLTPQG